MEFSLPPGENVPMVPNAASKRLLDVNEKNNVGATALEMAALQGHMPVVR